MDAVHISHINGFSLSHSLLVACDLQLSGVFCSLDKPHQPEEEQLHLNACLLHHSCSGGLLQIQEEQ